VARRKDEYCFSNRTLPLFLCVCGIIALLIFILGYQIGRVHGVAFPDENVSSQTTAKSKPTSRMDLEPTPAHFESETLSFYKSVHRATPIIQTNETQKQSKPAKPTPFPTAQPTPVFESLPTALSTGKGHYAIQVAAFSEKEKATALTTTLQAHDYPAFTEKYVHDGTTMYRVRIGHFNDRQTAEKIVKQLKSKENLAHSWIVAE